jgi:hypothetical protein
MGYYIYHQKATLNRPIDSDTGCYFLDEIDEDYFDVGVEFFEKYFQIIECPKLVDSVLLIDDPDELAAEKIRLEKQGIFSTSNKPAIERYIRHNGYDKLIQETNSYNGRTVISFFNIKKGKGFYTEEVFENPFSFRNSEFEINYPNQFAYTRVEVFEQACRLEFPENEIEVWQKEIFENEVQLFRTELIGKYESGKSILTYL